MVYSIMEVHISDTIIELPSEGYFEYKDSILTQTELSSTTAFKVYEETVVETTDSLYLYLKATNIRADSDSTHLVVRFLKTGEQLIPQEVETLNTLKLIYK